MDLTERIQMLLSMAKHPSRTAAQRLELRGKIQILQMEREMAERRLRNGAVDASVLPTDHET
jgi:hypothetical protein